MHDFEESIQPNPFLKALLLDAVENQVRDKTPPEAGEALARLKAAGISGGAGKGKDRRRYGQVPLHDAA